MLKWVMHRGLDTAPLSLICQSVQLVDDRQLDMEELTLLVEGVVASFQILKFDP